RYWHPTYNSLPPRRRSLRRIWLDLPSKRLIGMGKHADGLYYLRMLDEDHPMAHSVRRSLDTSELCHARLGHP
ncbi:unnamed protein product, partial [Linum tenue]